MILNSDPQINGKQGYFLRMQDRIETTLDWLNEQVKTQNVGADFDMQVIATICMMDWVEKRQVADLKSYSHLQTLRQKWSERASVLETRIPA